MRIEANLESELDGKKIRIQWKNNKKRQQLIDIEEEFVEQVNALKDKYDIESFDGREVAKLDEEKQEEIEQKSGEILAERRHAKADVMFEFDDGLPDEEWFGRDEFPSGQFEFLEQVFTNPQIQT